MLQQSDITYSGSSYPKRKKPTVISRQMMYYAGASASIRAVVLRTTALLERAIDIMQPLLQFDDDRVQLRVCSIKNQGYTGVWHGSLNLMEIDPMFRGAVRPLRATLSTLIHELKHAQQYHSGRLKHTVQHGKSMQVFEGQLYTPASRISHARYLALPYEVEAREAESTHIQHLCEKLGVK